MVVSTVPDWLMGFWRRLSLETENKRDTETQVFYLQTPTCFGDLRIPSDRPELTQASFSSLTQEDILALSKQQGFSGITQFNQGYCHWVRYIDYQPPQTVRDIGLLHWDDILVEEGVEQSYREEWQKVDDGDGDFTALILEAEQTSAWQASLVTTGDYFIYSQNRAFSLPPARSLTDCLMNSVACQQDYLACEISFGLCQSGKMPWEIQRSTIPWREGSALWQLSDLAIDLKNQQVLQRVFSDEATQIRHWKIQEWGSGKVFQT